MLHKNRIELHNSHIIVNKIHISDLVTEVCRYLAFSWGVHCLEQTKKIP